MSEMIIRSLFVALILTLIFATGFYTGAGMKELLVCTQNDCWIIKFGGNDELRSLR